LPLNKQGVPGSKIDLFTGRNVPEAPKDQAQSTYLFTAGSRLEHTQVEIEEFMQPSNECVVKWHAKACDLNLLQSSVFWSGTHAVHRQLEVNRRSTEMDPNIAFFFPC